jgi:hypothetical protein
VCSGGHESARFIAACTTHNREVAGANRPRSYPRKPAADAINATANVRHVAATGRYEPYRVAARPAGDHVARADPPSFGKHTDEQRQVIGTAPLAYEYAPEEGELPRVRDDLLAKLG